MTGLPPVERFQNHKARVKASWFVKRNGKGLLPELFEHLSPIPYESAIEMEEELADELQEKGRRLRFCCFRERVYAPDGTFEPRSFLPTSTTKAG